MPAETCNGSGANAAAAGCQFCKADQPKTNALPTNTAMAAPSMSIAELVLGLYEVEGLKFGEFTMRTGEVTPVYIDMRVIWSYPKLVKGVADHIWSLMQEHKVSVDAVCGLPYQGIPLATRISTEQEIPMLLKRKSVKKYGTCKAMEGHYKPGQTVAIIDDVVMTGGTFVEDIPFFQEEGLKVEGCFAFFDREQGGKERTKQVVGTQVYCVVTLSKAFEILLAAEKVTQDTVDKTMAYIRANRFDTPEYGVSKDAENGKH